MIFVTVSIIGVTVIKFFFGDIYAELKILFAEYFGKGIDLSLVLAG